MLHLTFLVICFSLGLRQSDHTPPNSIPAKHFPIHMTVFNNRKPDHLLHLQAKAYLTSLKLKVINDDDLKRLMMDNTAHIYEEMARKIKEGTNVDENWLFEKTNSVPPYAQRLLLSMYSSDNSEICDSASVSVGLIPRKTPTVNAAKFINNEKHTNDVFLKTILDSCVARKYFH